MLVVWAAENLRKSMLALAYNNRVCREMSASSHRSLAITKVFIVIGKTNSRVTKSKKTQIHSRRITTRNNKNLGFTRIKNNVMTGSKTSARIK